jgi:hypothetical protein
VFDPAPPVVIQIEESGSDFDAGADPDGNCDFFASVFPGKIVGFS